MHCTGFISSRYCISDILVLYRWYSVLSARFLIFYSVFQLARSGRIAPPTVGPSNRFTPFSFNADYPSLPALDVFIFYSVRTLFAEVKCHKFSFFRRHTLLGMCDEEIGSSLLSVANFLPPIRRRTVDVSSERRTNKKSKKQPRRMNEKVKVPT